jgi:hypothetical protein
LATNKRPKSRPAGAPRKLRSHTPVVIAIAKKHELSLKLPSQLSLTALAEGKGTATDWFNLTFRLCVGFEVAKSEYTEPTAHQLNETLTIAKGIRARANKGGWYASLEEVGLLRAGLNATDEMQDTTTRRVQLDAHLVAKKYMSEQLRAYTNPSLETSRA